MALQMIEMMKAAQQCGHAAHVPPLLAACGAAPTPAPVERWRQALALLALHVPLARRSIAAGRPIQHAGDPFLRLHLIDGGACKSVCFGGDGRQQIVALHFRGDWIGFDGIASDRCDSDASTLNDCEIWSVSYAAVLKLAAREPALAHLVAAAMSEQLGRNRTWRNVLGTLSAVQRVADFLNAWQTTRHEQGPEHDRIVLVLTRAEIGNYLGLTIETVSRAFSQLEHCGLIRILPQGRRHIGIPDRGALRRFATLAVGRGASSASHQPGRTLRPALSVVRALSH